MSLTCWDHAAHKEKHCFISTTQTSHWIWLCDVALQESTCETWTKKKKNYSKVTWTDVINVMHGNVANYTYVVAARSRLQRQYDTKQLLVTHFRFMLRSGVSESRKDLKQKKRQKVDQSSTLCKWAGMRWRNGQLRGRCIHFMFSHCKPSCDCSYYNSWLQFVYFLNNSGQKCPAGTERETDTNKQRVSLNVWS